MADLTGMLQAAAGSGGAPSDNAWDITYSQPTTSGFGPVDLPSMLGTWGLFSTPDTFPNQIYVSPDGNYAFVLRSSNDTVVRWDLLQPWLFEVSGISPSQSYTITTEATPTGLFFKYDGTKMYIVGTTTRLVQQYSLATAWDITTASYDAGVVFSVSAQDSSPQNICFSPDGTKFYLAGATNQSIFQYSLSPAWDITTLSYVQSLDVSTDVTAPSGISFINDGSKFITVDRVAEEIYSYDLATNWDISTASYTSVRTNEFDVRSAFIKGDDGVLVASARGSGSSDIYRAIVSCLFISSSFDSSFFFKPDGLKLYVGKYTNSPFYSGVSEYDLASAWDLSTATFLQDSPTSFRFIFFKPDGSKMFAASGASTIREYDLSSNWDISTLSAYTNEITVSSPLGNLRSLFFKPDGTVMYFISQSDSSVYEYALGSAWDLSTATLTQSYSLVGLETYPVGLFFKPDGTRMYVTGYTTDAINEFELPTPWDISTASYVREYLLTELTTTSPPLFQYPIYMRSDGQLWFLGNRTFCTFEIT